MLVAAGLTPVAGRAAVFYPPTAAARAVPLLKRFESACVRNRPGVSWPCGPSGRTPRVESGKTPSERSARRENHDGTDRSRTLTPFRTSTPFGAQDSHTALNPAEAALAKGYRVNLFASADGVYSASAGQTAAGLPAVAPALPAAAALAFRDSRAAASIARVRVNRGISALLAMRRAIVRRAPSRAHLRL